MSKVGRIAHVLIMALAVGSLTVACSLETDVLSEVTVNSKESTPAPESTNGVEGFCAEFKSVSNLDLNLSSQQAWEARLAATERVTRNAPSEVAVEAKVYLQMVKDRVALVADYGYVSVPELPPKVRNEFIAAQQDSKTQADTFIQFAKETCGLN